MPYVDSHGIRIHYEVSGSGDAVLVLLHSYLCSGYMWHNQVDALARNHTVINVDARGHGSSGAIDHSFPLEDMVDDVVAVLDAEGVESAVWVGLSIGGMVALRAALMAPQRVQGLVILDSDAGAESPWGRIKYSMMGAVVRRFGFGPMLRSIIKLMFGATTLRERPELVEEWRIQFRTVHVPSMLNMLPALMRRRDLTPRLGEIDAPTLVIVGEEDRSLPPTLSQRIVEGVFGSTFVQVPGAGHLSVLEEPDRLTELLGGFLEGLRVT